MGYRSDSIAVSRDMGPLSFFVYNYSLELLKPFLTIRAVLLTIGSVLLTIGKHV